MQWASNIDKMNSALVSRSCKYLEFHKSPIVINMQGSVERMRRSLWRRGSSWIPSKNIQTTPPFMASTMFSRLFSLLMIDSSGL